GVLDTFRGTPTELGALADFAARHDDWSVHVFRCAAAEPGGPMDDALYEEFLDELRRDLAGGRWDGVYLSLHGALATGRRPCADRDLVAMVRACVGAVPIGASFDMHANLGPEMVELLDIAAGYKTLPHIDMHDTAAKVLALLDRCVRGEVRPKGALVRPGHILHSFNMRTTDGPMRELEELALRRSSGPILDITPFGGFPYCDSPHTGASVMVYADADAAAADAAAREIAGAVTRLAPQFAITRPGPRQGLEQALAAPTGTVAILESGDNTYSGGIADTTGLFRALVDMRPDVPCVFAYFCDPDLVARAHAAGIGGELDCELGGRVAPEFGAPVPLRASVETLTEGVFTNKGPMQRGVEVRMGRSAVLRTGSIAVIVTERRQPVNDLAYMELHRLPLDRIRLLCVKAKNHFRAAFAPHCAQVLEVDTPGPAGIDLGRLPYRHADRAALV
ncbi:MAG: M81 family metallopeptidase, partial [Alphaproteobacteria bacterium]|nr:M81 family metallopeptidase [Alphaproteobacteria bacterium]